MSILHRALAVFASCILCEADASLTIIEPPGTILEGVESKVCHPEGIAFSPTGDSVAVVNAASDAICFHRRLANDSNYEITPSFTIEGPDAQLSYPHDVAFSPNGEHLAVANSQGQSVNIYKKSTQHDFYEPVPMVVLKGRRTQLHYPHAVKYVPTENAIAVANVYANTIAFFHYEGDDYEQVPYYVITQDQILDRPDGLAFSSDGELLAVASHGNHLVPIYQRQQGPNGEYSWKLVEVIRGFRSNLYYPHSLSFHPSNEYLAVSNAAGAQTLLVFKKVSDTFPRYGRTAVQALSIFHAESVPLQSTFPEEGGVKGVAFAPNGNALGICSSNIADLHKSVLIYPIGLIYP